MASVTLWGASYSNVGTVNLPKTGGGNASFHEVSGTLPITSNGQQDVTGYQYVNVNVPSGGTPTIKTTTTTNDANTATSISFTKLTGEPIAFFVRCATQMQSSGSTTYYYVSNMRYNGTNVNGNAFRMGSTRQVTVVSSGYSYAYSNGTLTLSSSGNRTTSPGSFFKGTYELTYIY